MKTRCLFSVAVVTALTCASAPIATAQSADSDTEAKSVRKEASDVFVALEDYSIDQKDAAMSKAKAALDELDADIDALEASIRERSNQMTEATRKKADEALTDLRNRRSQVTQWYGELEQSSREAWNHVKEGFSSSYSALRDAWKMARKEFDEDA